MSAGRKRKPGHRTAQDGQARRRCDGASLRPSGEVGAGGGEGDFPPARTASGTPARDPERWARVHIEADNRPLQPGLFPRLGRYMGEGLRRARGGTLA